MNTCLFEVSRAIVSEVDACSIGIRKTDLKEALVELRSGGIERLIALSQRKATIGYDDFIPLGLALTVSLLKDEREFSSDEYKKWITEKFSCGGRVVTPFVHFPNFTSNWFHPETFIVVCHTLSFYVNNESFSPIEMYARMSEILATMHTWEQQIVLSALKEILGDIEALATAVTASNINFVMSTFKLSINLPLIYEFCSAASLKTKFIKLWQFLEVNGLLWTLAPWEAIQRFFLTCYKIIKFLVTKTKLAIDLAKEGMIWAEEKLDKAWNETKSSFSPKIESLCAAYSAQRDEVDILPTHQTKDDLIEFSTTTDDDPLDTNTYKSFDLEDSETEIKPTKALFFCKFCRLVATLGCKCGDHYCETHTKIKCCFICNSPNDFHLMQDCNCPPVAYLPKSPAEAGTMERQKKYTKTKLQLPDEETKADKPGVLAFLKDLKLEEIGTKVCDWLEETFVNVTEFFESHPLFGGLLALAASVSSLLGFTLPFFLNSKESTGFIKRLTEGMRSAYYCNRGSESLFGCMSSLFSSLREVCGIPADKAVRDFKIRLGELNEEALQMKDQLLKDPGKFLNNSQKFMQFKKHIDGVRTLYNDLCKQNGGQTLTAINPIWNSLNKLHTELTEQYAKLSSCISERPVPVVVWIYGGTDLGKSDFLSHLADLLNQLMELTMLVMTLSKGTEFWNTFSNQDIIKIDDFGAWCGPEGLLEALSMFNLVTNAAFNPSMAALSEKNIMATPKFIFIASNHPTIPSNCGVQDIKAFERRRHLLLNVTWPGHEGVCEPGQYDCEHWQEVKKKNALAPDYSHLQFTVCDRLCHEIQEHVVQRARGPETRTRVVLRDPDQIRTGQTLTPMEIAETLVQMWNDHEMRYQQKMSQKLKTGVLQAPMNLWENKPNIILSGPPGCGKTTLIEQVRAFAHSKDKTVAEVNTLQEFELFMENGQRNTDYIFFHDTTQFVNSPKFENWILELCQRYDEKRVTNIWLIASNPDIFEDKVIEIGGIEKLSQVLRRCEIVQFTFRKWYGIKSYTAKDVEGVRNKENFTIDDYVNRTYNDQNFSFGQCLELLKRFQPKMQAEEYHSELPYRMSFEATTKIRVNLSTNEFVQMCCGKSPISIAANLVSGNHRFQSTTMSFQDVVAKLYRAVRKSGNRAGAVLSMDALLLDGWNYGVLSNFGGDTLLVTFHDATYYIDGTLASPEVGKLLSGAEICSDVIDGIDDLSHVIDTTDLLSVTTQILPPWYMYCADIVLSVFKIAVTSYVATAAMDEVANRNAAYKMYSQIKNAADTFTENKMTETIKSIEDGLGVKESPDNKNYVPNPRIIKVRESPDGKNKAYDPRYDKKNWRENLNYEPEPFDVNVEPEKIAEKQLNCDPALPQTIQAITPNLVEIYNSNNKRLCYGIMVRGKLGTTVNHLREAVTDNIIYVKKYDGIMVKAHFSTIEECIDRLDFVIDDPTCPDFRDITNHISSVGAPPPYATQGVLVTIRHDVAKIPVINLRSYKIKGMQMVDFQDDQRHYNHIVYEGGRVGTVIMDVNTYAGDCGSVLLISDPNWQHGKIIGMHVGAGQKEGYARVVWRDHYLQRTQQTLPHEFHANIPDPLYVWPQEDIRDPTRKGVTKNKQHVSSKTCLYRNVSSVGERLFEPGILSSRDPRGDNENILLNEAKKWCRPRKGFTTQDKNRFVAVTDQLADHFADVLARENVQLNVLTRTAALNKLSGCTKSEPINVKTSPGFPFSDLATRSGKQDYITFDEKHQIYRFNKSNSKCHHALMRACNKYHRECDGGAPAPCVFKCFLKDEPRKLKKIYSDPSTRTIAGAPLDFQIEFRRYLHSAMAHCAENWHQLPPKIGINPLSLDWNTLYHRLCSKGHDALALDYKGWDFSPDPFLVSLLPRFWNRIYRRLDPKWQPEHDKMREVLYGKVICFLLLVGCTIYETTGGVPSGYPGTSPDNSILNIIVNAALYVKFMEKHAPQLANVWSWLKDVEMADYGDDVLQTFSKWFASVIDLKFWKQTLFEWGFEVTAADKSPELKLIKIWDAEFLSRRFRSYNGMMLGPLNEDRLWRVTWWVHDRPAYEYDPQNERVVKNEETIYGSYLSLLNEACLHGPQVYEKALKAANEALSIIGSKEMFPSYNESLSLVLGANGNVAFNPAGFTQVDLTNKISHLNFRSTYRNSSSKIFSNRVATHYGPAYTYSGVVHRACPIPTHLEDCMQIVNTEFDSKYNSVLINEYDRGGGIPYHKDNEPGLDLDEGVACLTIAGDGVLQLRSSEGVNVEFVCSPGMCYRMTGNVLRNWTHSRNKHYSTKTISLTFRKLDISH